MLEVLEIIFSATITFEMIIKLHVIFKNQSVVSARLQDWMEEKTREGK